MSTPRDPFDAAASRAARRAGTAGKDIAARFGISTNTVYRSVREGTPESQRRGRPPAADGAEIVRRWRTGESGSSIAAGMGVATSTVYRAVKKAGEKTRLDRVDADDAGITAAYAGGGTIRGIARQFGVSRDVVERRVRRAGMAIRRPDHRLQTRQVVELYRSGLSVGKVAGRMGSTRAVVLRRLKAAGIRIRGPHEVAAPVGTVRWLERQGFHRIKTAAGWRNVPRWTWEQAHGPIAPGWNVVRIDGASSAPGSTGSTTWPW